MRTLHLLSPTALRPTLRVMAVMTLAVAAAIYSHAAAAAPAAPMAPPRAGLIVQDQVALRGAPRDSAPSQALLWRGEGVEIRGERGDHVQVWDYRRERGGYVRKSQILAVPEGAVASAELLAQLRLARLQAGAEGLGLGLAAAYVQAATPAELTGPGGAEALSATGELAERLADRASAHTTALAAQPNKAAEALLAAQLDVAARYGLRFINLEAEDGRVQVCFEGDAFRRVLAIAATPEQQVRAALALTRPECGNSRATPKDIEARDAWRAEVLAKVKPAGAAAQWQNRWLMRRASVAASLAFAQARRTGFDARAAEQASAALSDFAGIATAELSEDDMPAYNDAAMRVNAARWLAQPAVAPHLPGFGLSTESGAEGETCVILRDAAKPASAPLAKRCSYGLVALASASVNREGNAVALAVQPLDGWRELWVFSKSRDGWRVNVLPPAAAQPGLGFAEFAGWVPGGTQMLVAREARAEGRHKRSFEVVSLATLLTERQAGEAKTLGAFQRWSNAAWVQSSLSQR